MRASSSDRDMDEMLFSYQENRLEQVLEDHAGGVLSIREALVAVVDEEEVLQEIKSENPAVIQFLSSNVGGLLDLVSDQGDHNTVVEILCSLDLSRHVDRIFRGLVERPDGRWERLAVVAHRKHRRSVLRFVDESDIFERMVDKVDDGFVARTMCQCFKGLEKKVDCGRLVEKRAGQVLLEIGENQSLRDIPLDTVDMIKVARRFDPESAADRIKPLILLPSSSTSLGAARLEAVRLICDLVVLGRDRHANLFYECIDLFFRFPNHAILHRAVSDALFVLVRRRKFRSHENDVDDGRSGQAEPFDGVLCCLTDDRFLGAAQSPVSSSLRAHATEVCEAVANELFRATASNSSWLRSLPKTLLDDFLRAVVFVVSKRTSAKQGISPPPPPPPPLSSPPAPPGPFSKTSTSDTDILHLDSLLHKSPMLEP